VESAYEHRDLCAIAGIGASDFSFRSGRSVLSLGASAALAAISDAGLLPRDIDGIVRSETDALQANDLAHALGMPNLTYWGSTGGGGSGTCGMMAQAVGAVTSGQARNVLVVKAINGNSGARFGVARDLSARVGGNGSLAEFFVPHGLAAPGQMWALVAQRHMYEFGTRPEQLAGIVLTCRKRANANPAAQMYAKALTLDDYLAQPVLSSPLGFFDYCLRTDGACAVVITRRDRAAHGPHAPVLIRAVTQAAPSDDQGGSGQASLLRKTITTAPSADVARNLYARAGMAPEDIDVAQFYDCFSVTVLVQLEDYGFCAKGEGGPFAASGALELDGRLPINTAGGNLSEGYLQGMNHILEGVRQIRGASTSQVSDAAVCLVTAGLPTASGGMILRADG
jgi:acetyl-CoA acetyltransferase